PVAKADLFASVWKDTAVTDDALTSCIQELRRALGDDARQPRFIETRHRRGYQFVARLSEATPDDIVHGVHGVNGVYGTDVPPLPAPDISAIAVLPFADMSAGRDQDYLCEGLADELITALSHVDGLRVASRTASFQFRAAGADVQEVGRHRGVATLREGSVRKADERLRVTVQLIDVSSG